MGCGFNTDRYVALISVDYRFFLARSTFNKAIVLKERRLLNRQYYINNLIQIILKEGLI